MPLPRKDYEALDRRPRDGMLMREREAPGGEPGRVFYSVGGGTFQVSDERSLRTLGLDGRDAVVIPRQGLDQAPRSPQTGTLLRLSGSEHTWVINGGTREITKHVCAGARVNKLPPSNGILTAIPMARTAVTTSSTSRPPAEEPDPGDDLVAEACGRAPGNEPMAATRGTLTNHTQSDADYVITIRLLTESGRQLGETQSVATMKLSPGEARRWEHKFAVAPGDLAAIDRCEYFVTRTQAP